MAMFPMKAQKKKPPDMSTDAQAGEVASRLRSLIKQAGWQAMVLTHPQDVRYLTGYHSILERWGQMEPLAAAIVYADAAKPLTLVVPEANIGVVALLNRDSRRCYYEELRTFDMLNFCEVSRYLDPYRQNGRLGEVASTVFTESVKGFCQPDIVQAVAAALSEAVPEGAVIGFDEWRASKGLMPYFPHQFEDGYDLIIQSRVIKTPSEIARYKAVGRMADQVIGHAASLIHAGADWTYKRVSVIIWYAMTSFRWTMAPCCLVVDMIRISPLIFSAPKADALCEKGILSSLRRKVCMMACGLTSIGQSISAVQVRSIRHSMIFCEMPS
jgi:Xaa-Pro aminopeptidase